MWKFFIGLIVGIAIAFVGTLVVLLAIGKVFSNRQPTIAGDSVLLLALTGDIPEAAPVDISIPFLQSEYSPTIRDLWTSLRQAANDHRIRALVIQPESVNAGWGKLEEIRQDLLQFKKSGKPVYAYLEGAGSKEYYLASVADKIFVSPDDSLDVKGFLLEEMYFKDTLDKLGIQVQVDHIGKYKDAGDLFTRTGMTPETRQVLNDVTDQIYNSFCADIGMSRRKTVDQVKTLIDAGPFLADRAKNDGLVDVLGYPDEMYSDLKSKIGTSELHRVNVRTYFRAVPAKGDRIAVLVGEGDIVRGDPNSNSYSNQSLISSAAFIKLVRSVRDDSSVKGVVVRVNSPGGDAVASDEILHELKLLSAVKPLAISMSDVAASGGYLMSMTGSPIFSYPDTITGSIGVLYLRPNLKGLYDKLGITEDSIMRGKMADIDSPSKPLSEAETAKLHEEISSTYSSFLSKVAKARRKTVDQVEELAQGRVWMGVQARQNGLVDNLGSLDDAVKYIRQKAGLPSEGETNLVVFPPRRTLLDLLAESSDSIENNFMESRARKLVHGLPSTALLKGGVMSWMPYYVNVH